MADGLSPHVFAFYKPRPMVTDLTRGPMAAAARRMCPEAPPKPVGQLDRPRNEDKQRETQRNEGKMKGNRC